MAKNEIKISLCLSVFVAEKNKKILTLFLSTTKNVEKIEERS
jgi:hypothetical protein